MATLLKPQNRILISLLVVVGALVALSIALVLSRSSAPVLELSTPEGTIQRYTQALLDGDDAGAAALMDPASTTKEDCQFSDAELHSSDLRITLGSTSIVNGKATVEVTITRASASGPFGTGESSYRDTFELRKADDSWTILSFPWPLLACTTDAEVK